MLDPRLSDVSLLAERFLDLLQPGKFKDGTDLRSGARHHHQNIYGSV